MTSEDKSLVLAPGIQGRGAGCPKISLTPPGCLAVAWGFICTTIDNVMLSNLPIYLSIPLFYLDRCVGDCMILCMYIRVCVIFVKVFKHIYIYI